MVAGVGLAGPWLPFGASVLANPAAPRPFLSGPVSLFPVLSEKGKGRTGRTGLDLPAVALSAAKVSRPGQLRVPTSNFVHMVMPQVQRTYRYPSLSSLRTRLACTWIPGTSYTYTIGARLEQWTLQGGRRSQCRDVS